MVVIWIFYSLRFAWIISERDSVVSVGMTAPLARRRAPEECRWLALKRKKKSALIMKRPTWTRSNNRYVFLGNWQQTVVFLSASSLPDRCLPSTSKSSAQTVIKLSGIGLCWGSGGKPSWSYTSAGVIRLVLVFLRIVQVPESVAGFASLVAGAKFIRTSVGCHESPHRDIRSSQSHFSYSTRVLKSFSWYGLILVEAVTISFFSSVRSSNGHPDLLVIQQHHHPTFLDHTGPR